MRKTWYNRKADDTIDITDDIGSWGVSVKSFLNDLRAVKGDAVHLRINSPGGDVFAGVAIYNALRSSGKKVYVKVLGIAASAASLIAMAGDEIEMPENAMMMIHNPWILASGDADDLRATADVLEKIGESLVGTYAARTGKPADEIRAMLSAETWFTAQEAVDAGFATKMTPAMQVRASFDLERLPENARAAFVQAKGDLPDLADTSKGPDDDEDASHGSADVPAEPPADTQAEQVQAVCKALGMEAYAALWALDPALPNVAAVKAQAEQAREIRALCALAKQEGMADGLIRTGTPLSDARVAIFAALDAADEHIDTTTKAAAQQAPGAQPAAVKTSDIWAARRKHLQGA